MSIKNPKTFFRHVIGLLAGLAMTGLVTTAFAASDLDKAINAGAKRLTGEEIAGRLTGKTATFVTAGGDKTFLIFYGEDNKVVGSKVGGGWSDSGFQAITDGDKICLGWKGSDLPKLRCFDVLLIDGELHKFKPDGSRSGQVTDLSDGNTI